MNRNRYRLVFNRLRGQIMAVAENAASHSSAPGQAFDYSTPTSSALGGLLVRARHGLPHLLISGTVFVAVSLAALSGHAQIVADRSAPAAQQATILNTASGIPQINIQTPSAAGVSRNTYTQFDVQRQGAVLNNSRQDTQTQLAGWVQANPWLVAGNARVILNEVNSSNPSQLKGYIEVAGDRAQVVIANPAGISCDGCGFVNASRATLTTGTPVLNGGSLDSYRVQGGIISIDGAGMDASRTDYTDLISRAVKVNAGIWANELKVTTGLNVVTADHTQTSQLPAASANGPAPGYAIDVAQLGGMYAGKIVLVGTEAGLGMRNAGQIGASIGEIKVTVDGHLENSGKLNSAGSMDIVSVSGVQNHGTIYAQGNLTIETQGDIQNDNQLLSKGNLNLSATGIGSQINSSTNAILGAGVQSDGSLSGNGSIALIAEQSIAIQGSSASAGDQTLHANQIDLHGSQIQAGNLTLIADTADANMTAATAQISNALTVTAAHTARTDGAQVSAGRVQVNATDFSNQAGQVGSGGDMNIALSGKLDNTQGLLWAGGTLSANADTIDNHQIASPNNMLGIQGRNVTLVAGNLNNTSSFILADETLDIQGSRQLINRSGTIASTSIVKIRDVQTTRSLVIDNTDGNIVAGSELTLASYAYAGMGNLTSQDKLSFLVDTDTTLSGTLKSTGDMSVQVAGTLANQGTINAGNALTLTAATLDNRASGVIEAASLAVQATDTHTLTNRGLINGGDTFINAITFNNFGTGRIYGDHVAISAVTLTNASENGASPVIAARNRLDLGIGTLNNSDSALIYSAGDMAIGGALDGNHQATGTATSVLNSSASIVADGNLAISTAQTINKRTTFSTAQTATSEGAEYVLLFWGPAGPNATLLASWAKNSTTTIASDSGAGRISSGGNMLLTGTVTNDKSDILAGGSIVLDQSSYTGISQQGQTLKSVIGASFYCACGGGFVGYSGYFVLGDPYSLFSDSTARNNILAIANDLRAVITPSILQQWSLTGVQLRTATLVGYNTGEYDINDSLIISPRDTGGLTPIYTYTYLNDSIPYGVLNPYSASSIVLGNYALAPARLVANQSITGTATQIANLNVGGTIGTTPSTANAAPTVGNSLTLPTSSLYTVHPGNNAAPLVETDARFINHSTWLSSDYMLSALSLDPALTQKRLGDGFYEQTLVRDQIAQLTGRRFLDGYASEEMEYQALMDAGVTYAKAHNLVPGVALSATQIAQLTSDMVWLETQTVTLPDGSTQQVLVPHVYVVPKAGDLSQDGALIAANDVNLKMGGDLNNSGTILGRNLVALSANNLNIDGSIKGKLVGLDAVQDITLNGGEVRADSQLSLQAGRNINVISTTTDYTASSAQYLHTTTTLDRVAGLYVTDSTGTLSATAGQDITLTAAKIDSSGTASLSAGRNLTLNTLATQETLNLDFDADNYSHNRSTAEAGTTIKAQGNLSLTAGSNITARAASITSQNGAVSLAAGGDIQLLAGEETHAMDAASKDVSGGFFSSKTTIDRTSTYDTYALATTVSGNTVTAIANRDLTVKGSNVVGTQDVTLAAGNQLTVSATEEQHTSSHFHSEKESGLFSSGGLSVTLGTRSEKLTEDS